MKTFLRVLSTCLIPVGSLLAQDMAYYKSSNSTSPGYWEVSTDYHTNGTAIRYYNPDRKLIHQEVLPNQLVKLTKRNVRRLDVALAKINSRKAEPSNVKTMPLPNGKEDSRVVRTRRKLMEAERRASPEGFSARIIPTSNGSDPVLKVFIYNPHEEQLRVDILNAKGNTVCQVYNNDFQHYYRFNMSGMPSGDYRVKIYKMLDKTPTINSLVSLSRQPSQTLFSMKPEISAASPGDSLATSKK